MSVQEIPVSCLTMLVKERPLGAGKSLLVGPDSFLSVTTSSHHQLMKKELPRGSPTVSSAHCWAKPNIWWIVLWKLIRHWELSEHIGFRVIITKGTLYMWLLVSPVIGSTREKCWASELAQTHCSWVHFGDKEAALLCPCRGSGLNVGGHTYFKGAELHFLVLLLQPPCLVVNLLCWGTLSQVQITAMFNFNPTNIQLLCHLLSWRFLSVALVRPVCFLYSTLQLAVFFFTASIDI